MDIKALLNTIAIILLIAVAYASFWVLVVLLVGYIIYATLRMATDPESKS